MAGSIDVSTLRRRYSSSRKPYARRWTDRERVAWFGRTSGYVLDGTPGRPFFWAPNEGDDPRSGLDKDPRHFGTWSESGKPVGVEQTLAFWRGRHGAIIAVSLRPSTYLTELPGPCHLIII